MNNLRLRLRKITCLACVAALSVTLCTGCSNERKEEQRALRLEGITLMENGKYEEALVSFQEALDLSLGKVNDVEMDICFYKAEAQYYLGDVEGAMATYTALIEAKESAKAYFLRGNLYYSLEDEEHALADYASALAKEKKNYELYIGIYEALTAHGREQEAQEYLNQALEINANSAYDKMQKGRINYMLGEELTAISLLEEAAKGKEMQAYYYLAEIYTAMEDEESAANCMQSYMESGVADSYTLFEIANDELGEGNYEMAIECLTTALNLDQVPNRQILMKTLVIAYEQNLDFSNALKIMTEYVKDYPEDEEAKRELTFLETRVPADSTESDGQTQESTETEETTEDSETTENN